MNCTNTQVKFITESINNVVKEESIPYIAPKRPGRNEPCYCGSGKKYKKCCLNKKENHEV